MKSGLFAIMTFLFSFVALAIPPKVDIKNFQGPDQLFEAMFPNGKLEKFHSKVLEDIAAAELGDDKSLYGNVEPELSKRRIKFLKAFMPYLIFRDSSNDANAVVGPKQVGRAFSVFSNALIYSSHATLESTVYQSILSSIFKHSLGTRAEDLDYERVLSFFLVINHNLWNEKASHHSNARTLAGTDFRSLRSPNIEAATLLAIGVGLRHAAELQDEPAIRRYVDYLIKKAAVARLEELQLINRSFLATNWVSSNKDFKAIFQTKGLEDHQWQRLEDLIVQSDLKVSAEIMSILGKFFAIPPPKVVRNMGLQISEVAMTRIKAILGLAKIRLLKELDQTSPDAGAFELAKQILRAAPGLRIPFDHSDHLALDIALGLSAANHRGVSLPKNVQSLMTGVFEAAKARSIPFQVSMPLKKEEKSAPTATAPKRRAQPKTNHRWFKGTEDNTPIALKEQIDLLRALINSPKDHKEISRLGALALEQIDKQLSQPSAPANRPFLISQLTALQLVDEAFRRETRLISTSALREVSLKIIHKFFEHLERVPVYMTADPFESGEGPAVIAAARQLAKRIPELSKDAMPQLHEVLSLLLVSYGYSRENPLNHASRKQTRMPNLSLSEFVEFCLGVSGLNPSKELHRAFTFFNERWDWAIGDLTTRVRLKETIAQTPITQVSDSPAGDQAEEASPETARQSQPASNVERDLQIAKISDRSLGLVARALHLTKIQTVLANADFKLSSTELITLIAATKALSDLSKDPSIDELNLLREASMTLARASANFSQQPKNGSEYVKVIEAAMTLNDRSVTDKAAGDLLSLSMDLILGNKRTDAPGVQSTLCEHSWLP